MFENTVLFVII